MQKHMHRNDINRISSVSNMVSKSNWMKEVNGTMRGYKACNTTILAYELNWSPKMQKVLLEAAKKEENKVDSKTKAIPRIVQPDSLPIPTDPEAVTEIYKPVEKKPEILKDIAREQTGMYANFNDEDTSKPLYDKYRGIDNFTRKKIEDTSEIPVEVGKVKKVMYDTPNKKPYFDGLPLKEHKDSEQCQAASKPKIEKCNSKKINVMNSPSPDKTPRKTAVKSKPKAKPRAKTAAKSKYKVDNNTDSDDAIIKTRSRTATVTKKK